CLQPVGGVARHHRDDLWSVALRETRRERVADAVGREVLRFQVKKTLGRPHRIEVQRVDLVRARVTLAEGLGTGNRDAYALETACEPDRPRIGTGGDRG